MTLLSEPAPGGPLCVRRVPCWWVRRAGRRPCEPCRAARADLRVLLQERVAPPGVPGTRGRGPLRWSSALSEFFPVTDVPALSEVPSQPGDGGPCLCPSAEPLWETRPPSSPGGQQTPAAGRSWTDAPVPPPGPSQTGRQLRGPVWGLRPRLPRAGDQGLLQTGLQVGAAWPV